MAFEATNNGNHVSS